MEEKQTHLFVVEESGIKRMKAMPKSTGNPECVGGAVDGVGGALSTSCRKF